eukprot:1099618-Prymnesium_polylepis.2
MHICKLACALKAPSRPTRTQRLDFARLGPVWVEAEPQVVSSLMSCSMSPRIGWADFVPHGRLQDTHTHDCSIHANGYHTTGISPQQRCRSQLSKAHMHD